MTADSADIQQRAATAAPAGVDVGVWARFCRRLFDPVDNGWLIYFRILFGIEMLYTVWEHFVGQRVLWYSTANFQFKYYGFEWVKPWPGDWLTVHYAVLGALSAFIIVGFCYRFSMTLFFFGFTYVYLIDQADYLNHYYLVCLIALVMIFLPAHRSLSVDAWLRPKLKSRTAPAWALWLLRIQVAIPYFFGGIAKLNADWLRGEPMHIWLIERADRFPLVAEFFTTKEAGYFFSYGGLFYDLFIIPMLLWKRTRLLGYGMTIFFHFTNSLLFNIGIFPWLMMLGTLIFFPVHVPRQILQRFVRTRPIYYSPRPAAPPLNRRQKTILAVAGVYLALNCLVPFRHWLYPGNVNWNEEGHRFSWHMMLRTKRGFVNFYAYDPTSGESVRLDPVGYLSFLQVRDMCGQPDMILQFAHFLGKQPDIREELANRGFQDVEIRVEAWVSLNGRWPQLMIDPNVDLSKQPRTLGHNPWITELTEPLRDEPFSITDTDWMIFQSQMPQLPF